MMLGNARETETGSWAHRHQVFVLPVPPRPGISSFSFRHGRRLMDEAGQLTEAWLPTARPVERPPSLSARPFPTWSGHPTEDAAAARACS